MSFPKQRGVGVARPLSLLRRERDRSGRCGRAAAVACAGFALAAPPLAVADSLRPDPPAGTSPAALQPDAFPSSAAPAPEARTPASAVVPVPKQRVSGLGSSLEQPPAQPHSTAPHATTPTTPVRLPPAVTPVTITSAIQTVTAKRRVVARHAAEKTGRSTPRAQLPTIVHGSSHMAIGLLTPVAATLPAPGGRRDLAPAALALLALVATSGCLLAVAARCRREGLGV